MITEQPRILTLRFNRLFSEVFNTIARYIDIWGGRARGGSHFATDYFLFLITQPKYFRGVFLRAIHGDIKDSLWKDFKDRLQACVDRGELRIEDFAMNNNEYTCTYLPTGNSIISKGFKKSSGNQSAKLKSIAGCTHAVIEECEEVGEEDFAQFDDSLRTDKVQHIQVLRLFNPPGKNHWLIKRYYNLVDSGINGWYKAIPKDMPELLSIHSTYLDNISNINASTIKNYEAYGNPDSPTYNPDFYHRNVKGLVSEGQKGRIFTKCQPIPYSTFKELPYASFYGLDFGFNDPVAVPECKYHNGKLFLHQLIYQPGLDNDELADQMEAKGIKRVGTGRQKVYADSAEPKSIKALNKKGFIVEPAEKGADSIAYGIRELQSIQIFITSESKDFWLEAEEYHWMLDAEKNPTDTPEDAHNHLWDATRYAYTMHVKKRGGVILGTTEPANNWESWIEQAKAPQGPEPLREVDDFDLDQFYS